MLKKIEFIIVNINYKLKMINNYIKNNIYLLNNHINIFIYNYNKIIVKCKILLYNLYYSLQNFK